MRAGLAAVAAAVGVTAVIPAAGGSEPAVAAAREVSISFVHALPGLDADVLFGDRVVIDGFEPGSIADITAFRGRTLEAVSIVDDATGRVVLGPIAELDLAATGSWSLVAHLDGDGHPTISSFENARHPSRPGEARLTFRHVAHASALDLVIEDQRPVANAFNGDAATIELAPGTLADARIAPTGGSPILELEPIELAPATDTVVYAVGALDTLDIVRQVIDLAVDDAPGGATGVVGAATTGSTTTGAATGADPTAATAVAAGSWLGRNGAALLLASFAGVVILGGGLVAHPRARALWRRRTRRGGVTAPPPTPGPAS